MNNPALVSLLGIKNRNILGQRPEDTLNWQSIGLHMPTIMQSVDQIGMWQGELWEKDTHDQQIPLFVKAHKIDLQNDSDHADLVLIISDIRNVKEVERLDYLAHHDPLTGLGNRSKLYNFLEDLITNNQQGFFSLIFLDLDGFKAINDNHGHDAGDEVLKVVAKRLPKLIRDEDQAFRLAGDEFVIVMLSGDTQMTDKLSQRVLDLISQPISFADKHLKVGVSVGVHVTEVDETPTITSLLKDADIAMYQAKSKGKGRVIYSVKEK